MNTLPKTCTIIITGHSLGAAIAPIAALGLVKSSLARNRTVYVLPSVGASPGVQTFADRYLETFPPKEDQGSFRVFNTVFYNRWDVVPQAWSVKDVEEQNMNNILAKIYNTAGPIPRTLIGAAVKSARGHLSAQNPPYVPLHSRVFEATKPDRNTWKTYLETARRQHIHYYWPEIGIDEFYREVVGSNSLAIGLPFEFRQDPAAIEEATQATVETR